MEDMQAANQGKPGTNPGDAATMPSDAEIEIRTAVVDRLRELVPSGRIIHELNTASTGSRRIDVACVTPDKIYGVELKSEKDKLDRLQIQWDAFTACCHHVVVAAHRKFFVEHRSRWQGSDSEPMLRLDHPLSKSWAFRIALWCHPTPEFFLDSQYEKLWSIDMRRVAHLPEPRAAAMLDMLWRDELFHECARHGVSVARRATRSEMIREMAWHMTGKEVCHAVCRQLRARDFTEADAPIVEEKMETHT